MVDSTNSSRILEISQPCVNLAEAASTELPLNVVVENNRTSLDVDAILGQEIHEECAFPFPDPVEIQGSINSHQGAQIQGISSSLLSQNITTAEEYASHVEQWTSRAASSVNYSEVVHGGGALQPPNISYGRPKTVELADASFHIGQNPQIHFPFSGDPYEDELKKLCREEENLKKNFEETTLELKSELERKMAEVQSEYDMKSQEVDDAYKAKAMEEEANWSAVSMSSLLANAFMSKCIDRSKTTDVAGVRARSSHHSIQQQQAVQRTSTIMHSTTPPSPRPSVTVAEASILNLSGPLLRFPRCNMTQPRRISQQASVQSQSNTYVNSTPPPPPPRPSVTAAEAPILNPSGPLKRFPRCNMTQPRPISQQASVQSQRNTHMNSIAPPPPQPSVTAAETPILNPSGPRSHFRSMTRPTPTSQQASVQSQSNTHMNSTALTRPSVTPLPHPRPPPLISNLTPSLSSVASSPAGNVVRAPAPHLQPFRSFRAPNSTASAAAASPTYPRQLIQEQQQQRGTSNGGLVCLSDDEE